ncbi:Phosphopantothenate-cysteine ligase /Phosphopantothenoylcysteine decarboxylase [Arboricoccus pini]|uniref:Coenzyme A biosynthesis bifunctional protein CoaBC n=1 Tax=Arboricoccus pini TaxID=1963835 RepID=A0A212QSG3_9PROT|nr:bifunctional phosphopantothenoylcysteine decarboxylase/phosphopantothenate--cysteine ligase CoaBC [Arboricoccus pini]SNB62512.1 Phosphopantothenate-cysteine ligase /Phosphopantothenoylcysteine decarboxylase [Arboricoccus pini]
MQGRRILLVIGGGIAAYKCLELIRRGRERGLAFHCVMTAAAKHFVTPLSVAALAGDRIYDDLFSLTDEAEMGHIRLSREADLVVVAPATADLMAKLAGGHGDDLASTLLLAADKPVLLAPAMNPQMWAKAATRRNASQLAQDGCQFVGPDSGDMACGEVGSGRMAEAATILDAIEKILDGANRSQPLVGMRALVTGGPTHEPIDPVRFLANRSSGRQSYAIAAALAEAGAAVTLVSGPVALSPPAGVERIGVTTAVEMLAACEAALPVDIAICAAAVGDWRPLHVDAMKIKKVAGKTMSIELAENPDILASLSRHPQSRPRLVVGFAAETGDPLREAMAKLERKGCDWIVANDVSPNQGVFGGLNNTVTLLRRDRPPEAWPTAEKTSVAKRLVAEIALDLVGEDF